MQPSVDDVTSPLALQPPPSREPNNHDVITPPVDDVTSSTAQESMPPDVTNDDVIADEEDSEFEFAIPSQDSPITADEIFADGRILPLYYPLFGRDVTKSASPPEHPPLAGAVRGQLRQLLIEERASLSSSSSDADELEGIPADSYCVWDPNSAARRRCKKSGSTGSTAIRPRIRNLVGRSRSDGRQTLFFFEPDMKRAPASASVKTDADARINA